jgi:hypothetical protein
MGARILRTTRTAVVLATVLTATNARASDNDIFPPLGYAGGITATMVTLGFTAYDLRKAARGEVPETGVAFAEIGVMAAELLGISAISAAVDPHDSLPVFAIALWPAALMVHGIWALTLDRPGKDAMESRSRSLDLAPTVSWGREGPRLGVLGRF